MPIYLLDPEDPESFPPPEKADRTGLLAVGGDLSPERLLAAYARGIFPWYSEGQPILWHSPNPRFVLEPEKLHVGRSLRKVLNAGAYEVRWDTAFADVITACSQVPRPGQTGTWITDEMLQAYVTLHRMGFAHSIEAWAGGELKGGLYGVSLGAAFFGESMFARAPDASKAAFATAVERFVEWGFQLIDCQVETEHLARFGAEQWPRRRFLTALERALKEPTRRGPWT
ncbi:leucyl/phenylalanyl-tRNA--protein transferase [Hyalangium rubrum]|uniref:Leucyl/phenylalanyl-tRNA--protein transferase n=1 Tax=Hyalangium rubrum TaxID=3103134 RepID=A0ABU5H0C5_9BACT|nr:leucyl/phenylalanyl-tRNA--protein transferase [Hyalangium sp. s54d21]MDY7226552.1 leucyl/phenylalanyl-tRNA--protein transferase [Hyalangium sp. s54d21]